MVRPKYGDFGMYFIPLNFATITAFFMLLGLMLYSAIATPYYVKYMWLDAFGLSIGLFTFIGFFVIAMSILFLYLSVKSFKEEKVGIPYFFAFIVFYWYLMISYNVLFVVKELRREEATW